MVAVVLLPGHGYIPLLVVGTMFVNSWAGVKVSKARKKYNVLYPQMYSEQGDRNAKEFNCVQRAHQHLLEQLPSFFALLFASAPFRPGVAAITGAIRVAGFIFFVRGYVTGDPKKCMRGRFVSLVINDQGFAGKLVAIGLNIEAGLRIAGAI